MPNGPLVDAWLGWANPIGWGSFLVASVIVNVTVQWVTAYDETTGWLLAAAIVIGAWLVGIQKKS